MINKVISASALCIALVTVLFSCTDVPISRSTLATDQKIFGYWQKNDSTAYYISKNDDGSANLKLLKYKNTGYINSTDYGKLFFAEISGSGGKSSFISIKDGSTYNTYRFNFDIDNNLVLRELSDSYMEKDNKQDEDGVILFGTPDKFKSYVTAHINDAGLFEKSNNVYIKKSSFSALTIPKSKASSSGHASDL